MILNILVIFRLHVLNMMVTDPEFFIKKNILLDFDGLHDQYMAYLMMESPNDPYQRYCNLYKLKEDSELLFHVNSLMNE
jgi:hypothetical protein